MMGFTFGRKDKNAAPEGYPSKKEEQLRDDLDKAMYALAHQVECTLATVESLEMKKNPPKYELKRQKDIANMGLDTLINLGYATWGTKMGRVSEAIKKLGFDVDSFSNDKFHLGVRK